MRRPDPFRYPSTPHVRRHGPAGYADYHSFRDWLRDEFDFRCVFCLCRETWGQVKGAFDIDHFQPRALRPDLTTVYDNLVYACRTCNCNKSAASLPDPGELAYGKCLAVHDDGTIHALTPEGEILIDELDLDAPERTRFRRLFIDIVAAAAERDSDLLGRLMGLPDALPSLNGRPPSGNSRPHGLRMSWHAKRARGEDLRLIE